MSDVRVNDAVHTPLGNGVVQFYSTTTSGVRVVVVRLKRPGDGNEPRCLTPRATHSSLWMFAPEEVTLLSDQRGRERPMGTARRAAPGG